MQLHSTSAGQRGRLRWETGRKLDFESGTKEYTVEVTATDLSLASDTITVTITVTNVSLGTLGDRYDANNDEVIDKDEVLAAVKDYFADRITGPDVIAVVRLYFSS